MRRLAISAVMILAMAAVAQAYIIQAGSGDKSAFVEIEFKDGAAYLFEVFFDGTVTGWDLLETLDNETDLIVDATGYGGSMFIDGFTYDGHSNIGYGGGEDWWHYWIRNDGGSAWQMSPVGCSGRTVDDGCWDGWTYGFADPPAAIPEPATAAMLLCGLAGTMIAIRRCV